MRSGDGTINRREAIKAVSAAVVLSGQAAQATPFDSESERLDVVVVGGGPAGLSAALVLGRACRSVVLCDAGRGRNAPAEGVHGFLGQDGTPPAELRRVGREQLEPYGTRFHEGAVVDARPMEGGFEVVLDDGGKLACRKLILATGMVDVLPEIRGLRELWGKSVIHCPYCHGWEFRGRRWAFVVPAESVVERATLLLGWTKDLVLLTNGPSAVSAEDRAWLEERSVAVVEGRVESLEGDGGALGGIVLEGGRRLERDVLFLHTELRQASDLAGRLGCEIIEAGPKAGLVKTDPMGATAVEGLYVAGDASEPGGASVAMAVADGALAASAASRALFTEDALRPSGAGRARRE